MLKSGRWRISAHRISPVFDMSDFRPTETVVPDALPPVVRIFAPGTEIGRRYEVRRVLGTGGSAVVYAVLDRDLGQDVALKVLRAERTTPASLKRFRREVAIAREADNPHLVRVFDIGEAGETVFLAMELVVGASLRERIAKGPLHVDEAVRIGSEVLEGLAALHGLGIVHRDVKPGNILIASDGAVKVTDFGLARRWERDESRATATDTIVGTLEYMSPEQALGHDLDARSDLYGFGIVLFEMLTGEVPFQGGSSLGMVVAHLKEPAPSVASKRPEVPAWLSRVVARLLEKDPADRYATAQDVLADLGAARAPKRVVRRKPMRTVLAVTAAAGLLLAGFLTWKERTAPRFSQLVGENEKPLKAIDARGRVLWSRHDLKTGLRVTRFQAQDHRTLLAACLQDDDAKRGEYFLSILDPETGEILKRTILPSAASAFPDYNPFFIPNNLRSLDLWGDGVDAVVVPFAHSPYSPSYVVVYDPVGDQARVVFIASGHHRVLGAVDVDGDGRKELILKGPSNAFGYVLGLGAVKIPSRSGFSSFTPAATPDRAAFNPTALEWYALGPRFQMNMEEPRIDERLRFIEVPSEKGRARLGFDGFFRSSALGAAERNAARRNAYDRLREADRLLDQGFPVEALNEAVAAEKAASEAVDDVLLEWSKRVHGVYLLRAGRIAEGEVYLGALAQTVAAPSEISLEAGRALHLAGDLNKAVAWYERALGSGAKLMVGPPNDDTLEGLVFAFGEMGHWDEARVRISRYERLYAGMSTRAPNYREYVLWRSAGRADRGLADNPFAPDIDRYWSLEFRAANGEPPEVLLPLVDARRKDAPSVRGLLLSLKAALLERQGNAADAFEAARESYALVLTRVSTEIAARAHLDLVIERYARLAERAGKPAEARAARAELARVRRKPRS
jgi:Protein kinase domain